MAEGILLVAEVRDEARFERAIRKLIEHAKGTVTEGDALNAIHFGNRTSGSGAGTGVTIHYALEDGLWLVGFWPQTVSDALEGLPRGSRLSDGDDYARVAAHLHASPETLGYLNVPRLLAMVDESTMARAWIESRPEARKILDILRRDEWSGVGLGSTSVATGGGLETRRFGPTLLSSFEAYRGLTMWGGVSGLFSSAGIAGLATGAAGAAVSPSVPAPAPSGGPGASTRTDGG